MESAGSVAGCVMYDAVGPDDGYVTIDCWLVDTLDDGLPVYVEWRSNLQSSSPVRLYNRTGPNYGIPVSDTRDDGWVLVEWRACSDLPGDCSPWVGHVTK